MADLLHILRFVCVSHLTVFVAFLLVYHVRLASARYAAAFCVGLIVFLLIPVIQQLNLPPWCLLLPIVVASTQSFFFWMLALSFFRDSFRSRTYHWLILILRMLCTAIMFLLFPGSDLSPTGEFLRSLPIVLFSMLLVGLGLYEALREFDNDLIESRRRLRVWYLVAGGFAILFVTVFRLGVSGPSLREIHDLATMTITLTLCYAFILSGMQLRPALIESNTTHEKPNANTARIDSELNRQLIEAFEVRRIYREEGLTIRGLARRLETHEYRLRRLINAGLGYRNFNDFLNRYRVQEACEILLDPEQGRVPVVRIATDLGYRSPGSFNKAFRELTGQTPTEFRRSGRKLDFR